MYNHDLFLIWAFFTGPVLGPWNLNLGWGLINRAESVMYRYLNMNRFNFLALCSTIMYSQHD